MNFGDVIFGLVPHIPKVEIVNHYRVENFPFLLAQYVSTLSETLCSYGAFLMFCQLKKGKLKLSLHHSLVQCCVTV